MLSAKKKLKEVKGDIMNVKRTKQENEQFSSQNSSYIYGKKFQIPKPERTPDMNEKEKRQGTLIFFYC